MKKLIAAVLMSSALGAVAADAPEKYQRSCFACHSTGTANAPMTGDAEAWKPRLEKGMDTLLASIKNGMGAMPPTGLCAECTDEELVALIEYMATPAQ